TKDRRVKNRQRWNATGKIRTFPYIEQCEPSIISKSKLYKIMQKKLRCKSSRKLRGIPFKLFLTVKLSFLLMTVACMQVSASAISQKLSLSVEKAPMEQVIKMIKKRSG